MYNCLYIRFQIFYEKWVKPEHQVYRGALIAHRHNNAPPRCRTSQDHLTFIHLSVSLNCGTILLTLYSTVWVWRVSRAGPMLFCWPKLLDHFFPSTVFPSLLFLSIGWYYVAEVFELTRCKLLSPSLALPTSFNNNNINNNHNYFMNLQTSLIIASFQEFHEFSYFVVSYASISYFLVIYINNKYILSRLCSIIVIHSIIICS